jgi:8-amino-7-oxononanoate synthase
MLNKEGFNIGNSQTNIIPIIIGNSKKALIISKKLEKKGFYVVPIRPPSVPPNSSRLRISITSSHSQNNIKKLFKFLKMFKNEM